MGDNHTLALTSTGEVVSWGLNSSGQLGDGTTTRSAIEVAVDEGGTGALVLGTPLISNAVPVAFTDSYVVLPGGALSAVLTAGDADGDALTYSIVGSPPTQGTVQLNEETGAFGYTANGNASGTDSFTFQVTDGSDDSNIATVSIVFAPLNIVPQVGAGASHSVALKTDGTVWGWGLNTSGQLGDGSLINRLTPIPVLQLDGTLLELPFVELSRGDSGQGFIDK